MPHYEIVEQLQATQHKWAQQNKELTDQFEAMENGLRTESQGVIALQLRNAELERELGNWRRRHGEQSVRADNLQRCAPLRPPLPRRLPPPGCRGAASKRLPAGCLPWAVFCFVSERSPRCALADGRMCDGMAESDQYLANITMSDMSGRLTDPDANSQVDTEDAEGILRRKLEKAMAQYKRA